MIHIHYNYGPGVRGTTTQRRPKSHRRILVALVGLRFDNLSHEKLMWVRRSYSFWDICRRNAGSCKQQPNLAPIQCDHERVIFKMEISSRQPIEQAVKIQKRNNYKQKNFDFLLGCVQQFGPKNLIFHQIVNRHSSVHLLVNTNTNNHILIN